ncbi:MAG: type II toxin-antitoxin system RelE/ParE family toxin [Vicingaceae bacterium]
MAFSVVIDPNAILDIQEAIDYYDEQLVGLGEKFEVNLNKHINSIKNNPYHQVRYDKVRCLPLKKYPYSIHFTIEEDKQQITIRAVFHMAINPKRWNKRKRL